MIFVKKNNVKTCSIVNVIESTIARNSDWVLPIHAGIEIGVASTKAFLGQLTVLYILCLKIGYFKNKLMVYGRDGMGCFKCKNKIVKITQSGRSTFFCSQCQK